jgi:ABC-2 type transport system permease protein
MNPPSSPVSESPQDTQGIAPDVMRATRPMYWSIRRELWENRSIYIAPLLVAAIVLFASLISMFGLPRRMRAARAGDPAKLHAAVVSHYNMAPAPIILATFLVGFFYCIDALHGERRDRSILFWKSLPVSDRTTVLSKASIPLAVLPLIALTLGLATQFIVLLWSTAVLQGSHGGAALLWTEFRFFQEPLVMIYGLTVHVLWFAPIYGWLLLVSAWARRAPFLWALLPPLGMAAFERIAFSTSYFGTMLKYRLMGAMTEAFAVRPGSAGIIDQLSQLSPGRFLSAPGLWVGLAFTAAFVAGAIRLRRNREPI